MQHEKIQTAPGFVEEVAGAFQSIPERFRQAQANPVLPVNPQRFATGRRGQELRGLPQGGDTDFNKLINMLLSASEVSGGTTSELVGAVAGQLPDTKSALLERGARGVGQFLGVEDIVPFGAAIKFARPVFTGARAAQRAAKAQKRVQKNISRLVSQGDELSADIVDLANRYDHATTIKVLEDAEFKSTFPTSSGTPPLGVTTRSTTRSPTSPTPVATNISEGVNRGRPSQALQPTISGRPIRQVPGSRGSAPVVLGHELSHFTTDPILIEFKTDPKLGHRLELIRQELPPGARQAIKGAGLPGSLGYQSEIMGQLFENGILAEQKIRRQGVNSVSALEQFYLDESKAIMRGLKEAVKKSKLASPKSLGAATGIGRMEAAAITAPTRRAKDQITPVKPGSFRFR